METETITKYAAIILVGMAIIFVVGYALFGGDATFTASVANQLLVLVVAGVGAAFTYLSLGRRDKSESLNTGKTI